MDFAFISTMDGGPWGGSEELWSRAALRLAGGGHSVSASVHGHIPLHHRVTALCNAMDLHVRSSPYPPWRRLAHKMLRRGGSVRLADLSGFLGTRAFDLVVISNGGALPPVDLIELCVARRLPFVSLGQANAEAHWPVDSAAERYRRALPAALGCFFVSESNRRLAEKQIGAELPNAGIVRNPFNVSYDASPSWPSGDELRLACVGRLHPPSKGQDILLEALAAPGWNGRDWTLTLFGEGPNAQGLRRLSDRLGLDQKVKFAGQVPDVTSIWASHHALVLPSRFEGLPLAMVEAMLCGRPVIATDVAGHAEIVEDGVTGFLAEAPTAVAMRRALDRAWDRRGELREMGRAAATRIRTLVPADPVGIFAAELKALAQMPRAGGAA